MNIIVTNTETGEEKVIENVTHATWKHQKNVQVRVQYSVGWDIVKDAEVEVIEPKRLEDKK